MDFLTLCVKKAISVLEKAQYYSSDTTSDYGQRLLLVYARFNVFFVLFRTFPFDTAEGNIKSRSCASLTPSELCALLAEVGAFRAAFLRTARTGGKGENGVIQELRSIEKSVKRRRLSAMSGGTLSFHDLPFLRSRSQRLRPETGFHDISGSFCKNGRVAQTGISDPGNGTVSPLIFTRRSKSAHVHVYSVPVLVPVGCSVHTARCAHPSGRQEASLQTRPHH